MPLYTKIRVQLVAKLRDLDKFSIYLDPKFFLYCKGILTCCMPFERSYTQFTRLASLKFGGQINLEDSSAEFFPGLWNNTSEENTRTKLRWKFYESSAALALVLAKITRQLIPTEIIDFMYCLCTRRKYACLHNRCIRSRVHNVKIKISHLRWV